MVVGFDRFREAAMSLRRVKMRAVDARRFVREFEKECGKGAAIWHGKKFLLLALYGLKVI